MGEHTELTSFMAFLLAELQVIETQTHPSGFETRRKIEATAAKMMRQAISVALERMRWEAEQERHG